MNHEWRTIRSKRLKLGQNHNIIWDFRKLKISPNIHQEFLFVIGCESHLLPIPFTNNVTGDKAFSSLMSQVLILSNY